MWRDHFLFNSDLIFHVINMVLYEAHPRDGVKAFLALFLRREGVIAE